VPFESEEIVVSLFDKLYTVMLCQKRSVFSAAEYQDIVGELEMFEEIQIGMNVQQCSDTWVLSIECMDVIGPLLIGGTQVLKGDRILFAVMVYDLFCHTVLDFEHHEMSKMLPLALTDDSEARGVFTQCPEPLFGEGIVTIDIGSSLDIDNMFIMFVFSWEVRECVNVRPVDLELGKVPDKVLIITVEKFTERLKKLFVGLFDNFRACFYFV
jgi:hypothetical protein